MRVNKFRLWDSEEHIMIEADDLAFEEYAPLVELLNDGTSHFMQYTGMKDKEGKEIYEGDRVALTYDTGYVYFELGCFRVKDTSGYSRCLCDIMDIKVIGHIYE